MEKSAPIVLFVYNRPEHTRKTVESLLKNAFAGRSELFIYSDGSKNDEDEGKVESVRQYIHNISGFKRVEIIEREKNFGLAKSVISGVSNVLNKFSSVIVMEDDMVCSPFFLEFINTLLDFYKENSKVFSVTGYTFPIEIPSSYYYDVYASVRASSWGWGTWKNRWEKVDWDLKNFEEFISEPRKTAKFNLGGEDLTKMLKNQKAGKIDSWAVIWTYTHFINNAFCIYPVKSRVKNIGADNSGVHVGKTRKFDVQIFNGNPDLNLMKEIELNETISNNFRMFFNKKRLNSIIERFRK